MTGRSIQKGGFINDYNLQKETDSKEYGIDCS